jgi:hypothetical protein
MSGNHLRSIRLNIYVRGAQRWVSSMPRAQSFYDRQLELTWWFVMARIGQDLREQYEVPKELPPKLLMLVMRLADRDVLFPNISWQSDADAFGG